MLLSIVALGGLVLEGAALVAPRGAGAKKKPLFGDDDSRAAPRPPRAAAAAVQEATAHVAVQEDDPGAPGVVVQVQRARCDGQRTGTPTPDAPLRDSWTVSRRRARSASNN